MNLRNLLGNGHDRPPAPEMADADDVAKYTQEWAQSNPLEATRNRQTPIDAEEAPFAKQAEDAEELARNVKHKAEFPWLFDPSHGVRWDFNPVQLRNLSQTNTWVGMLVQTISKEVSETPWTIIGETGRVETQKRLSTHPEERQPLAKQEGAELPDATAETIHDLLMRPNPDITWQDMVEMWMGDLLEIGSLATVKAFHRSAYDGDELVMDADQIKPRALQPTAPEVWTKDHHERTGLVDGYWQFDDHRAPGSGDPDGSTVGYRGGGSPDFFDATELLWTDMTPRTNRRYGIPPTLLVEDFLQSLDLAITQEQQYLSRGSIPSGAWIFEEWDREHMKERRQEMEENVKGKPHKSLMFAGQGGDVRFEAMSMNFQELEFTERMKWYARVVASAFQVPTAVVGIEPERVNYNTFQGERENFESNTLGPYLQKLERVINHDLIHPHWGSSYRFEFKPGMSESTRKMISDRVTSEFNAGVRRRNEARREIGLVEVDDEHDGFQDEVVEGTAPDEGGPLDDLALALDKTNGAAVEFPNAGGPAFETHTTLIDFCDDLAAVCDGGVFVGDNEYPDGMAANLDGQPVRAVGVGERKAYAVWSRYRDEAVALSDPHTIDSASDVVEQSTAKQEGPFDDYPEAASENAQMALDARDDTDNPNDCGTDTGWARANQLADGEALSRETVGRMAAFDRHRQNSEMDDDEGRADCGWMMWKAWGGDEGVDWAMDKLDELEQSAGDSGNANLRKDEPLRETDDWWQFDVQPGMVDDLADEIAGDVSELFDRVLSDDEVQQIIDRLATEEETSKSLSALSRRLRELFEDSDVVARVEQALREETAAAATQTVEETLSEAADADVETDVDIDAIREQLDNRTVEFADSFVDEMQDDILDTVGDGWASGASTQDIADEIAEQADINEGWGGAEKIARQELHMATGEARSEVAADLDKIEVWQTSGDGRVRDAHDEMQGTWKYPGESFVVDYSAEGRGVKQESVPGDSEPGIGCRCTTLLRDRATVDDSDYAGDGSLN
jgi:phage portal protein BeeE